MNWWESPESVFKDFQPFVEWAEQAPDVPAENELIASSAILNAIAGESDMHIRYMLRWEIQRIKVTADVLRRMQEGQAVSLKCAECEEWLDIFEVAKSQPGEEALCDKCSGDLFNRPDGWVNPRITPSA